ncbi:MAG: cobalamin biosynthesis protein CobW, partial [Clostridiales bacterium]|nr:cobalamin biosynthesis protein CobW [Clostridiales bacterium]
MTPDELRGFLRLFVEDTHRVKGLVNLGEETFLVDCVGAYINISKHSNSQADNLLVVLAGEGMPLRKSLKEALSWYCGKITEAK